MPFRKTSRLRLPHRNSNFGQDSVDWETVRLDREMVSLDLAWAIVAMETVAKGKMAMELGQLGLDPGNRIAQWHMLYRLHSQGKFHSRQGHFCMLLRTTFHHHLRHRNSNPGWDSELPVPVMA